MTAGIKLTVEEVRERVENLGYKLLDTYNRNWDRRVVIETIEGYRQDADFGSLQQCKFCMVGKSNLYTLYNIDLWLQINDKSFRLFGENIYLGNRTELTFYCSNCEDIFEMNWMNVHGNCNCPICSGRRAGKRTSLAYLKPELTKEFIKSEHNKIPEELTLGSHENVYWKCSKCGHEWWAILKSRALSGHGCLACSGRIVSDKNRLSILFPEIAKEFHPLKNQNLDLNNVSYGSHDDVWWLCSWCYKDWKTTPNARTNPHKNNGCPHCVESNAEKIISQFLFNNNVEFISEFTFDNCKYKNKLPFDFAILKLNLLIEYDGIFHYKDIFGNPEEFKLSQLRDSIKTKYCIDNNINLLRIPYWEFDNIENILIKELDL